MKNLIHKVVYIAIIIYMGIVLYGIKNTYPFLTKVDIAKENWYILVIIGVSFAQLLSKDD